MTQKEIQGSVPASKPAPSEIYRFKPWHTALIFTLAFLLDLPFQIDRWVSPVQYPVHKFGGVLISGASSGIGLDIAVTLAKKNYTVYAGVRSNSDAKSIKKLGLSTLVPINLDVTSDSSISSAFSTISKDLKKKSLPFVGLINNAGISQYSPIEFHKPKEAEQLFKVNYLGTLKLTQKFLPLLRESHGRIINLSSVLGRITVPKYGIYSSSKHAVEALSDGLRRELLPYKVSVSVIEPGFVKTPIHDKMKRFERDAVDSKAQSIYPHLFSRTREERDEVNFNRASSPKVVSSTVLRALSTPHPQTRYGCANVGGIPSFWPLFLAKILPDRVLDLLLLSGRPAVMLAAS